MDENEKTRQLLVDVRAGKEDAFAELSKMYESLVVSKAQSFMSVLTGCGVEMDDLVQEAAMALYKAAMTYKLSQTEVTFGLYAKICINNRLISVRRKLTRAKKTGRATCKTSKPKHKLRSKEVKWAKIPDGALNLLSGFERDVLTMYLEGCSYKEIAEKLQKDAKSIDNAMYRIRSKLKKAAKCGE